VSVNAFMGAQGISLESGSHHTVSGNQVVSSGRDGISLFGPVSDTTVAANTVHRNGRHGIHVQAGAVRNLIQQNQATGNAQTGILVAGQGNRILGNGARSNGVTDLRDANPGDTCDGNVWLGNRFGTALPACTRG
jgi:parallel beta-helix repeat protein